MFVFAIWILAGLQLDLVRYCDGMIILDCQSGSIDAVEGDTNFTLTCHQYSGTVTWQFQPNAQATLHDIGTCTEELCQVRVIFKPFFQLQWLSRFSNNLTFKDALLTSRNTSGTTYSCGGDVCAVPVFVPAELGTPSVVLSRQSQSEQVTVTGIVNITRVYSSRGVYNCTWIRQQGGQSNVVTTKSLFPGPNVNKEDRSGRCDVTDSLDPTSATYIYKVLVYPGATEKTQTVEVASPPAPIINCTPSTGYVSEDTDVICTCSGSVGRPAGRLVWVRRINNVDTTVREGSDGQTSLQLTMTVNRSHDGNELRCDVDWVTDTTGPAYTVNVAYRTKIKAFNFNNMATNLTVNESDVTSVGLTCRSDGRPTPRMQLVRTRDGAVLKTVTGGSYTDVDDDTVVDHVISPARCEDTGTYMCVSDNQLGPEERQALSLFVNCVPRRADFPTVHYEGRPVHLSVNMVAFPLPETFTFVFHGPGNDLSEPVTSGILDMHCKNMLAAYIATCNITVKTMTSKDAGFYSVRIGNSVGNSTVIFEVKYFEEDPQAVESSSGGLSAGAAVGVTLAVVFVVVGFVVGFVVVWMWRRQWVLPCASSVNGSSNTEYNQSAVSPPVSVKREEQQNTRSNEMPDDDQQASNQYDILQLQDIGVRSDYAELSHYVNSGMKSASRTGKKQ